MRKITKINLVLALMALFAIGFSACGGHEHGPGTHTHDEASTNTTTKTKTTQDSHAGHDHSAHDHSGHDHSGHDHSGHDHSGHDHSSHDHSGHDDSGHNHGSKVEVHGEGAAFNANYVCPMHCPDSGAEIAGICPTCKMDYIPRTEHVSDGHTH